MGARTQKSKSIDVERVEVPEDAPLRRAVTVGSVNDPAEADADRLADRALSLAGSYEETNMAASSFGSVRRSSTADVDGLSVDSSALAGARMGGTALAGDVRAKLEHGFGTDLGAVRVHTGAAAAGIARQISARAFTHGNDVYFGAGEYRPGTADGDHVLAHEVAHTVQNANSSDVHRFPATWSTAPVPWKPLTASVFRPGEGASGGVYILTSKEGYGPVKKAVVKPVSGKNGLGLVESGEQLQFSDVALGKLLGLNAPASKVVERGGSEFADLVALCKTKQPPPKPLVEGQKPEPGLEDAQSFVIMSEVPNASSIASLADKAPTDQQASRDLTRAVFDSTFLIELGKLCIGDIMLGNPDRFVLGASNLGNVMVSMQDGKARLAAIDTTAYLPKAAKPDTWTTGWQSGRSEFTDGPGAILDRFFQVLVTRLKSGTGAPTNTAMPTWQVIETTYASHRDRFLADFDYGWNDAMITALALSDDDQAIDSITAGYSDDQVTSAGLKANLHYVGSQALGKSHDDSIGRSMAITASGYVQTINRDRLKPAPMDALEPRPVVVPAGKALSAEVVTMPSLPSGESVGVMAKTGPHSLYDSQIAQLRAAPAQIAAAHSEVDQGVSATKKRRKGIGSKVEVPRNRSVVSHYVVDATAMGLGGNRIADTAVYANLMLGQLKPLLGADFRGNEAAPVKAILTQIGSNLPLIESALKRYRDQLAVAATVVPKTGYHDSADLAASIAKIDKYLSESETALGRAKAANPSQMSANLKVRK